MKLLARIRAAAVKVRPALPSLVRDAAGFAGAGSVAYGCGLAWTPLGWIVLGVELLAMVFLTSPRPPPKADAG